MYIAIFRNDYDNITSSTYTDYDNCTNKDKNIPTLSFTIPCGLSFLCFMSLIVYTLIKPLIKNK